MTERPAPEISPITRKIRMDNVPKAGRRIEIVAEPAECARLAAAHGLLAVESFSAELSLDPWKKDGFRLAGTIRARVVQQCVVTLEPLPAAIEIPVDTLLVAAGSPLDASAGDDELVFDVDSPDAPETYEGNGFDAGAFCEELFALALDPYPRKPGAVFRAPGPQEEAGETRRSPFAGLAGKREGD